MSVVTNTILFHDFRIPEFLADVNEFFRGDQRGFVSVKDPSLPSGWYGGSKGLECELAIGAFNHLDLDGLIRHLCSLALSYGDEYLQLMVLEQDQTRFRIITIADELRARKQDNDVTGRG